MLSASPRFRAASLATLALSLCACTSETRVTQPHDFATATISELAEAWQKGDVTIIDARSPDAFNGWTYSHDQIQLDSVGGHIPGSQLFSARWIELQLDDLSRAYQYAGLDQGGEVIIYGQDRAQAKVVANWLVDEKQWHSDDIRLLQGKASAWAQKTSQPLDYLPGFRSLVPSEYVARTMKENPDVKIVQIGWDGGKGRDYRKEHIPGAVYWDDLEFEFPPIYEARPVEEIRASLARLGVDKNSSVIVYSTESIGSGRGAAIMKYAGVEDVVMLNGGINAWKAAGFELESGWNEPVSVTDFGLSGPGDNRVVIDIDEAKTLREQPNSALVSIRAWREYTGQVSGYDYFSKRGRIPGSLWGHAGTSSWNMDHYHNPDNTLRNYHQVAEFWDEWNIRPDMSLAFYCGNGWRASEVWWYAQAMGYDKSTIYSSGWMRWREDNNAVATGELTREQALAEWQAVSGT